MPAELVPWLPFIGVVLAAIIGGAFNLWTRRGGDRAKREPTWGELVKENRDLRKELSDFRNETDARFEGFDKKFGALVNVLSSVAEQWPPDHPGPELDPKDVEILADTLPVKFRRHPRRKPRTT